MNIELKTTAEIKAHSQKVLGLYNSTGKKLYKDIYEACQSELERRKQKKTEAQPIEKIEQLPPNVTLPTVEEMQEWQRKAQQESKEVDELIEWVKNSPVEPMTDEEWKAYQEWKKIPKEEKVKQHKEFIAKMDKKHGKNPVLTAPQPTALTKMPAPTKPIKWANGKVYEMNELDLRRKSVDYFSDVLNGKREPKDFYRSMQFNNLVRFQIGLYRFGNEVMEHKALHPTLEMCKKETQERSEELYRQVVEYWKQYKDTDIV